MIVRWLGVAVDWLLGLSTRAFALIAAAVLVIAFTYVAAVVVLRDDGRERPAPVTSAPRVPTVAELLPGAEDYPPAALRFAEVWAGNAPDRDAQLAEVATAELARGLQGTDGRGSPVEAVVVARYVAEDSAVIVVRLASGEDVAVLVVRDVDGRVRAGDVRPANDEEPVE